jgi:hypothetical protein
MIEKFGICCPGNGTNQTYRLFSGRPKLFRDTCRYTRPAVNRPTGLRVKTVTAYRQAKAIVLKVKRCFGGVPRRSDAPRGGVGVWGSSVGANDQPSREPADRERYIEGSVAAAWAPAWRPADRRQEPHHVLSRPRSASPASTTSQACGARRRFTFDYFAHSAPNAPSRRSTSLAGSPPAKSR